MAEPRILNYWKPNFAKQWTKPLVLRLLDLYKEEPVLWNPQCEGFKNKEVRKRAYKKIRDKLNVAGITIEDVALKLTKMRSKYNVTLSKTGSDPLSLIGHSCYWFHKADKFLRNVVQSNPRRKPCLLEKDMKNFWEYKLQKNVLPKLKPGIFPHTFDCQNMPMLHRKQLLEKWLDIQQHLNEREQIREKESSTLILANVALNNSPKKIVSDYFTYIKIGTTNLEKKMKVPHNIAPKRIAKNLASRNETAAKHKMKINAASKEIYKTSYINESKENEAMISCLQIEVIEDGRNSQLKGHPSENTANTDNKPQDKFGAKERSYMSKWNTLFDKIFSQWISFKPKEDAIVYPCYSCGDMFGSKNSFLDHVNRRGMLIKYKCPYCATNGEITFYNPCSFLLHARDHFSNSHGEINLDNVTISILPIGLAGFFQHSDVPLIYDVEEDNLGEKQTLNTRFYTPNEESEGKRFVVLKPLMLLFCQPTQTERLFLKQVSSNIPCCKFIPYFGNYLTTYKGQVNGDENGILVKQENVETDEDIEEVNFNSSEEMDETDIELDDPIATDQYPKCPECGVFQKGNMTEHFSAQNKPVDKGLGCTVCKYIASTKCSLKAHERIHAGSPPFVCPECGKDFREYDAMIDHLDYVCFHLAKHVRYRCPGRNCSKIFATSITFSSHFFVHFQFQFKCSMCDIIAPNDDFVEHNETHNNEATATKMYKCSVCKLTNNVFNHDEFLEHNNMHCTDSKQRVYVYTCKFCKNYFRSRETYAVHLLRCCKKSENEILQAKRVEAVILKKADIIYSVNNNDSNKKTLSTCIHCETTFESPITYTMHLLKCSKIKNNEIENIDPIKITEEDIEASKKDAMVNCVLCNEPYSILEIRDHCRSCRPVSPKQSPATSPTPVDQRKKRKKSFVLLTPKKKVPNIEEEEKFVPEAPIIFNGIYFCKCCQYESTDRKVFHEHIKEHRDVSTAYQCMECGECFVVKPSLVKHLNYFHQICNTDEYFEENDCFDKTAVQELVQSIRKFPGESDEPVEENQCKVCRQQFENDVELNKHFRVHGMAFLMKTLK